MQFLPTISLGLFLCASGHSLGATSGQVIGWGGISWPYAEPGFVFTNIACGDYHNLVISDKGKVLAWGYNSYGVSTVPPDLSNVVAVAAGVAVNLLYS